MTVNDENKLSKAVQVIRKMKTYDANDTVKDMFIRSFNYLEQAFKNGMAYYTLGDTVSLAALSVAGALDDDPYNYFVDMIEKQHGSLDGKRIIEIGAGIYPIVSERLLKRNPNIKSIDVYDPCLLYGYPLDPKIKLHPTNFDSSVEISDDDIIIAMQPCNATYDILDVIIKNKHNSTVMLCTCSDASIKNDYYFYDDFDDTYNWHNDIRSKLKSAESELFETGFDNTKYKEEKEVPYFYTRRRYVDCSTSDISLTKKKN